LNMWDDFRHYLGLVNLESRSRRAIEGLKGLSSPKQPHRSMGQLDFLKAL
jgi:hypothetical protein